MEYIDGVKGLFPILLLVLLSGFHWSHAVTKEKVFHRITRLGEVVCACRRKGEDASAQSKRGVMYGTGRGVKQGIVYAHMRRNVAASNEDEIGGGLRNILAKKTTPPQ